MGTSVHLYHQLYTEYKIYINRKNCSIKRLLWLTLSHYIERKQLSSSWLLCQTHALEMAGG